MLAVPSRIAFSVLYDGESDWTPPEKPKSERTDRDHIQGIEFFVDLDHPESVITANAGWDHRAESSGEARRTGILGSVVGINADFVVGPKQSAATIRSRFSEGKLPPAPAFRALVPAPPEYGLETRRADWSKPVEGRIAHGFGIFDVDVDYLSTADNTYIHCNDARQAVPPFEAMPTCQFVIVVPELSGSFSGTIDRTDVPRWRDLRAAALAMLRSFIVAPVSGPSQRPSPTWLGSPARLEK